MELSTTWGRTLLALLTAAFGSAALADVPARRGAENPAHPCGMVYTDHYGPYDYRTHRAELKIVEDFHFTPKVEMLQAGQSGWIGGDLNYTLRASPNHHRALIALVRWTERRNQDLTDGQNWPVECYFDRGIRYRPDDTVVRALYAQFLHKRKRTAEGVKQLEAATRFAGENAFSHYNIGLMYLELNQPDQALAQAHRALALGFPRKDLRERLQAMGKWREPEAPGPAAGEPTSGSAVPVASTGTATAQK